MKRSILITVFIFGMLLSGLTQVKQVSNKKSKAISQNKSLNNESSKIEVSYLDSLKLLKDTVPCSQINILGKLSYQSGTVYFSGDYFPTVAIVNLKINTDSAFHKNFQRCAPGSKIAFESVTWKDNNGITIGPLSKLFILQ